MAPCAFEMEFVAVAKSEVCIYTYRPGEEPGEPDVVFPPVPTAEGCVWSADGNLLGLVNPETGGVAVYNAGAKYELLSSMPPLIGGPVRKFYFSPLGNHLVTYENYFKDCGGNNVGVWDVRTGELRFSLILKKQTQMTWPPLKWTNLETHCCRMVQDGVQIMGGAMNKEGPTAKIEAAGIMAFEVAPRGVGTGPPHVAIVIGESKGAPARCQIFSLDDPSKPTASKTFFKAQTVNMQWNNTGSAVLVQASMEVDDTGKSYYGGSHLHFMRSDGEESSIIASPADGTIHDFQWNPTQDEFFMLHGDLPCSMSLYEGKKGSKRMEFGSGHRNTIRWNNFGRFLVLGGHGQLVGDTDFWDKPGKKLMGTVRMECCVVCGWAPDGRHFLGATTAPRMRVDNKIVIYDYCGQQLHSMGFDELRLACWRPRPRGAFQDRPPSPDREKSAKASGAGGSAAAAPKKQAYRPPGARGAGGGLADLLRKELGSTSAEASSTATKVGGPAPPPPQRLPPGASADIIGQAPAAAGANASRNARKKKAKEAAQAAAEAEEKEKLAAARGGKNVAEPAPAKQAFAPAPRAAEAAEPEAASVNDGSVNPEVDKKVRALRKKLRDIEKLKEKPAAELDPLQKEKIAGEAEIIAQIRALGAEP